MQVLWDRSRANAREITDALNESSEIAHRTVQTLLRQLEAKQAIAHDVEERTFVFYPLIKEDKVTRQATINYTRWDMPHKWILATTNEQGTFSFTIAPADQLYKVLQKGGTFVALADGDLKMTTDFRSVYATVLSRWLDINPQACLQGNFADMDLLKA